MKITGYYRYALLVALAGSIHLFATAQKLPEKQEVSFRAPDNIKIDGKASEWGNKYQAYNPANYLFYTIANDDKNLYLVIHVSDNLAIEKIVRWGIAFTISKSLKRMSKDPNNVSISFPVNEGKNLSVIHNLGERDFAPNRDSLMAVRNTRISYIFKSIQVTGIKEIDEPTISVYNTLGIKAVAAFDNKLDYTYELAVPLKYLAVSINNGTRFSYNIKLNGGTINPAAPAAPVVIDNNGGIVPQPDNDYLFSPTDFGGEYALAKK